MVQVVFSALVLVGILECFTHVRAQDGACQVDGFSSNNIHYNSEAKGFDFYGVLEELSTANTVNIVSTENEGTSNMYIDAVLNGNRLIVSTTDKFKDYAIYETEQYITLNINFTCSSRQTVKMQYIQALLPGNYYAPVFTQDEYHIKAALPARRGSDLTEFQDISAIDYDITSNNRIVFSSDRSDLFTVEARADSDPKRSHATIILNEWLQSIPDKIEFTITAKDTGTPPLSSTAKVIVMADPDLSMPPQPTFTKALYKGSLDKQKKLEMEDIELLDGTYADDVQFKQDGGDSELFKVQNQRNILKVELSRDLTDEDLEAKAFLTFDLIAERPNADPGTTAVVVGIPQRSVVQPMFSKALYKGSLNYQRELEQMEDIGLVPETYNDDVQFKIFGGDSELFDVQKQSNSVKVRLARNLTHDDLKLKDYLEFTLVAEMQNIENGSTAVVISIPHENTVQPMFSKALYKGSLNKKRVLVQMEDVQLTPETYTDDVQFKSFGGDSELFMVLQEDNSAKVRLARNLTEDDLRLKDYLEFTLIAEIKNANYGSTAVVISIPHANTTPVFSEATYHGELSDAYDYVIMPTGITVSAETYSKDIKYGLEGPDAELFSIESSYNEVTLDLKDPPLDEESIVGKHYLETVVTAVNENGLKGSTTVLVIIPNPIPEGPDENEIPVFSANSYYFEATPTYVGRIGKVYAKLSNSSASVSYSVQVANPHLRARLQIMEQTGTLHLTDSVIPGDYSFTVVATNDVTDDRGTVDATLSIRERCSWISNTTVQYTLQIISILEGEEQKNLFDILYYNCVYNLTNYEPSDQDYIMVDLETNTLKSVALDRESETFSRMAVPQITVYLDLDCGENTSSRAKRSVTDSMEGDSSLVLMKNIRFSPSRTTLTLLIEDVNDNPPVFSNPSGSTTTVLGYPEASVAAEILPENLIRVHATDKDAGLNAKIKYSISENDHFGIESETGIVYPTSKAMLSNNDVKLTVWATDLDGAPEGLKSSVDIEVKKILEKHLTLITVSAARIEDMTSVLANLSKALDLDIRSFRAGIVPAEDKQRSGIWRSFDWLRSFRASVDDQYSLKMWTYAFDKQNEPIENNELERKINEAKQTNAISAERYKAAETESHSGYIVTVSVLSVVVLILLALGFVIWWIFIRPYDFRRMLSEGSGETISTTESVEPETRYKNSGSINFDSSEYDEDKLNPERLPTPFYHHRNSMNITAASRKGSENLHRKSETDNETSDGDETVQSGSPTERPKSVVTFNEMVERIDIERVKSRKDSSDGERL